MIKFIEQQEKSGCAIACIAMVLGRTYKSVRDDWQNDFDQDGVFLEKTMEYLGDHDCSLIHKLTRNYNQKDFARKEMLKPFAPVHVVRVMPAFDSDVGHLVVMDARGKLICPQRFTDKNIRDSYAITDVVGIYRKK